MNTQMQNSKLLQYLLDYVEVLKKERSRKITSANLIFYAAIQFCRDVEFSEKFNSTDADSEEIVALRSLINGAVNGLESKGKTAEDVLFNKESYMDDLTFRQFLGTAWEAAKKAGKDALPADILIKCIMDSPTLEINSLITDKQSSADETPTQTKTKSEAGKEAEPDVESTKHFIKNQTLKAKLMQKKLSEVVIGQDHAISVFASGYFQAKLQSITAKGNKRPEATFLFAGPPGVGKTLLAENIAKMLEIPFKRFDMSEFADRDALMELCGTNPSYKEAKKGQLTEFVENNPECVLLFDEIEKAHMVAIHLFLQLLDAGRLRDIFSEKEIDFSKTITIFTTNAGRKIYEDSQTLNLSNISRKTILKALENDVDPKTGAGSFPAAICSRFATGNVVMFNHMEAYTLRTIVEKELNKRIQAFQEETGIEVEIPEEIYSCILFAEGGHADARTVNSRANSFLSAELYELFRLISSQSNMLSLDSIEKIRFSLELPKNDESIVRLFKNESKINILLFASESVAERVRGWLPAYNVICSDSFADAKAKIDREDISFVLCDFYAGTRSTAQRLNVEDIDSEGRDLFRYVCENTDTPLYVLCDDDKVYSEEEMFSLIKEGARGTLDISKESNLIGAVTDITTRLHHQESMMSLARSNKIVKYETAQSLSDDGKTAEIKLFELSLETAVDAQDTGSILSNMSKPNVTFDDVIGAASAKDELKFFVNYLKNPKAFASKGLDVPKGVLFYGPPGTGKTLLAKAMAGESNVTFISAEGNQFRKKYVGEGESAVHDLFATARKYAPTILFVDEVDAIAKERRGEEGGSDSILTAFLSEMDGFKTDPKKPVFVLAATNFDVEPGTAKSLDSAFLRRFDRHIYIDLPDKEDRIRFIKMRAAKNKAFVLSDSEIENIAVRSTGMSLANLENVFRFSLRIAVRNGKNVVDSAVFEEAFESYNYGEEKHWDESELERTARHEAGHALLCWLSGETPSYMTIVARGNHGGYMQHDSNEKIGSYSKKMLLDRIRTSLGGRAAELVYYGEDDGLTTGASGDLQNATAIARQIVCKFGMTESLGLACISEQEAKNGEIAAEVRKAVNGILSDELKKAKAAVSENKAAIDALVEELMEKTHLNGEQINQIFSATAKR